MSLSQNPKPMGSQLIRTRPGTAVLGSGYRLAPGWKVRQVVLSHRPRQRKKLRNCLLTLPVLSSNHPTVPQKSAPADFVRRGCLIVWALWCGSQLTRKTKPNLRNYEYETEMESNRGGSRMCRLGDGDGGNNGP
jgi:hypothetical protein